MEDKIFAGGRVKEQRVEAMGAKSMKGDPVAVRLQPCPGPALLLARWQIFSKWAQASGLSAYSFFFFLDLGLCGGHLSGWLVQQVFCDSSQPPMSCGDSSCLWSQARQEKGQAGELTVRDSAGLAKSRRAAEGGSSQSRLGLLRA